MAGKTKAQRSRFRGKQAEMLQVMKDYYKGKGKRVRIDGHAVRILANQNKTPAELASILSRCQSESRTNGDCVTKAVIQAAVDFVELVGCFDEDDTSTLDLSSEMNPSAPSSPSDEPVVSGASSPPSSLSAGASVTTLPSDAGHLNSCQVSSSAQRSPSVSGGNSPSNSPAAADSEESAGDPLPPTPRTRLSPDSPIVSDSEEETPNDPLPPPQQTDSPPASDSGSADDDESSPLPRVRRILRVQGDKAQVEFERGWVLTRDLPPDLVDAFNMKGKHAQTLKRFIEDEADESRPRKQKRTRLRKACSQSSEEDE